MAGYTGGCSNLRTNERSNCHPGYNPTRLAGSTFPCRALDAARNGQNMKILQVSPFDFNARGGVNEHVIQLDGAFRSLGLETRILAASSPEYGELDDGHLYRLGTAIPFPSNGSTARVTVSPFVISKVRSFLEREQFNVIHVHEPLAPVLPMAALLFSKALNVATFHAAREFNFWYHYIKAVMDIFVDRIDCRVAVSQVARDSVDSHFPGSYEIVPNGIDLDRFRPDVEPIYRYMDGKQNILFVGRFDEPRKGFIHLLRAMPIIRTQFPKSRLIVVGKGDIQRAFEQVDNLKLTNIEFVGAVRPADLPRYYATSDVYCAPSTGRESFGIVLLEALATGTPVVASNIPGYAGVVEHGETGILTKPADPQSLALSIVRVLADEKLRHGLRMNGLREVQRFGWNVVARRLLSVYEHGLARERPVRDTGTIPEALLERARG
ncbi:glycosyltransferase family 4 protein [soil metagenome]